VAMEEHGKYLVEREEVRRREMRLTILRSQQEELSR
jgi:hypothetical protein